MSKIFKSVDDIQPVRNKGSDKLGTGSFSKVNLVCHKQDPSKWYALKEVALKSEKDRKMVFQEINLHMTLKHDHVIRFEDYIETPGKVYIFLEYAAKGDLFGYVNKNKLDEQTLLKLFYQTCVAIEYIHSKNIMHRDLKPENILLDADLNIKICDFGWSAEYYEDVNRETLCGTYEYMAPEVFFRNKQTKKTDIWALGVLLYELFHGYAPFRGTRMDTVMHAIMKNVIAFKKSLSPDIKDLIVKILVFDPKKRPSINQILEHSLITNFIRKKGEPSPEKENVALPPKPTNIETKNFKKKPVVFSSSFYNTIDGGSEHKMHPKSFLKQHNIVHTPANNNNTPLYKPNDYSNYFKKKAKTEEFSSTKPFNSVDKAPSNNPKYVKRYPASQFQSQHSSTLSSMYPNKLTHNSYSFCNNVPSGAKLVSQRTIGDKNTSGVNLYSTKRPDFADNTIKNLYGGSGRKIKYNFVKQKSAQEGEKSFTSYLNAYAK